ncbi:unnamed protein product [Bursaphelenchus xylophilus]|uniref:(pine wood nematode) hypothetical protein n=1 Tax=Bursaphelenchus xylophilus TaxID=6326 RepID=A0A1I7RRW1_BURXY|nr:unnamed protein product [Bursaphelenchus xylophilus]CAG9123438.1 unnamed protein product [Bursaphelenchus xylophilus]
MKKSTSHGPMDEVPEEFRVKSNDVTVYKDKHIGAGNFADVFKGTYHKKGIKSSEVAVKVIRTGAAITPFGKETTPAWLQEIRNEAMVMTLFDHEHLIQLFGYSDVEMDATSFQPPFIVLEYCQGGSLDVYLQTTKNICVGERVQYLKEVASGMKFLEKEKIVHRDLASRNVLINNCGVLKISDFGLSRSPNVKEVPDSTHTQIPIRWMAPETLKRSPNFDNKSDMWAFGVFIYEIFTGGKKPWPNKPVKWIATQIRKYQMPNLPSNVPRAIRDIIVQKCWVKAEDRWTFSQLHSVLCLLLCSVFTSSKVSMFGYLEKKGVSITCKVREKQERWVSDIVAIEWLNDERELPRYDTIPCRPAEGNCGISKKSKSSRDGKREQRIHQSKKDLTSREVTKTPAISTTTSQGSSEDRNKESDDGKKRKALSENNRRSSNNRQAR